MKKIMVTFDVMVDDVYDEYIQEWLEYELGVDIIMSERNPLCGKDIEATTVDFQES